MEEGQEDMEGTNGISKHESVALVEFTSNNGWGRTPKWYFFSNGNIWGVRGKKSLVVLTEYDLNGPIVKTKTNTETIFAIADSGSPPEDAARN